MAELYAYIHSMPKSETPQKKKWIKRFNRENGNGTPLLKHKKLNPTKKLDPTKKIDSTKKLKSSIGDVLKAGQNFLFGNSVSNNSIDISKSDREVNKTLFKDSDSLIDKNTSNFQVFDFHSH
jgi:hypothetical protein